MRRAFSALAVAAFLTVTCAGIASAIQVTVANRINAIGLIDYAHKPTFKVGDYVRYRVNAGGNTDRTDYILTVLIAGEEEFWGEKCFWVETWTDDLEKGKQTVSSLMSYDIFSDTLADERIQIYRRKLINGFDENGLLAEELTRGTSNLSGMRTPPLRSSNYRSDTLGVDSVITPLGTLSGRHVEIFTGKMANRSEGDSSIYLEDRQNRSRWLTPEIPLTHVSREDMRESTGRKTWKVGYSGEGAPMVVKESSFASARVIEIGHGLASRFLPPERATSFEQQAAAARAASHKSPPARRTAAATKHH